jgi:pimeloyl-ACP methyl ester carboxylesterase
MSVESRYLDVPGAKLHYQVRGEGPVLLIIPGGPADGSMFGPLAEELAAGYRVVTYDPRGISESTRDNPDDDVTVAEQADDARRLLYEFGPEPAYVYGNSGGAITGLELVTLFPGRVKALLAHEPPVTEMLPDREAQREFGKSLLAVYREAGPIAAFQRFISDTGMVPDADGQHDPAPVPPEMEALMTRMVPNLELFFGHMFSSIIGYEPDIGALCAGTTRVVVARAATTDGEIAARTSEALADALDLPLGILPGDHGGGGVSPAEFAAAVHVLLTWT